MVNTEIMQTEISVLTLGWNMTMGNIFTICSEYFVFFKFLNNENG